MKVHPLPQSKKRVLSNILIMIVVMVTWCYPAPLLRILHTFNDWEAMAAYVQSYGALGPVMLALLMLVQVFVAFVPGHALVMASGYIYGATVTIMVVTASAMIGSQIAFWLARRYGRPLIYRIASPSTIERWERFAGNRGAALYFFSFVLPFFPSDMMCYVAGFSKVSGKHFLIANIAGRFLCTSAMTLLGVFKLQPPTWFWLLFAACLTGLSIAWWIYSKAYKTRLLQILNRIHDRLGRIKFLSCPTRKEISK